MPADDPIRRWALRIIWVVLAAISWPVLVDTAAHVGANTWTWYALAILPLAVLATLAATPGPPHGLWAVLGVAVGVGIEVWAIASGAVRIGRFGLAIAVIAVLLLQGRADRRNVVLLALCVPIPSFVVRGVCEPVVALLCRAGAALSNALGAPAFAQGTQVEWSTGVYVFDGSDLGASTALFGLALGWLLAADPDRPPLAVLRVVAAMTALAWLAHALVTLLLFAAFDPASIALVRPLRDAVAIVVAIAIALSGRTGIEPGLADAIRELSARRRRVSV